MVLTKTKYVIKVVSLLAVIIALTSIGVSNTLAQAKSSKSYSSFNGLPPQLAQEIITTANYYGLDPNLLFEIIKQESGFNPKATSNKNARGLMQMIPSTAKRFGVRDAYDPKDNLAGGCRYFVWLLRRYNGRLDLALAGYNAGEGAVQKYGNRVPPYQETQNYVRSITSKYISRLKTRPVVSKRYVANVNATNATSFVTSSTQLNKVNKQSKSVKTNGLAKSSNLTRYSNQQGNVLSKKELKKLATLDSYFGNSNNSNSNK
ncbi:MAG: lytic transglycosylase domain-containing protein [Blastocatellia bacterium]